MILQTLRVKNKQQQEVEIFLNADGQIFIQEIQEEPGPYPSWFTIDREDWPLIKEFIDKQFTQQD